MKTYNHNTTLKNIRRTMTPEHLGAEATGDDVRTYLRLLAARWPTKDAEELVDDDAADAVQTATFRAWCDSKKVMVAS